jgi:hypothetical protein
MMSNAFADLLLPNNQTMAEFIAPQLERVYTQGALPALLPGLPERGGGA